MPMQSNHQQGQKQSHLPATEVSGHDLLQIAAAAVHAHASDWSLDISDLLPIDAF